LYFTPITQFYLQPAAHGARAYPDGGAKGWQKKGGI